MSDVDSLNLVQLMRVAPTDARDVFIGIADAYGVIGVYGGHLLGQALNAGFATVAEPKLAQSFHAYFVSPGDVELPIEYHVTRLREGRNSELRDIRAIQTGRLVFQMTAAFKLPEAADEHQPDMPEVMSVETLQARATQTGGSFSPPPTKNGRSEMVLASDHFMRDEFLEGRAAMLRFWMRCIDSEKVSQRDAQVLLTYLSDGPLMFNSVIPHGLPFQTHRLTSIDHAGWFHRPCVPADWMLFDQHSSAAADGRGMNHGTIFNADGQLLMTVAQESLLRRIG